MATVQSVVTENYLRDARTLADGDLKTFLAGPDPPSNARILDHPPGYPLMSGLVYAVGGEGDASRVLQLALNSLAAVFVFLIGAELFDDLKGVIAGVLIAISPQFAYHSGLMLPDELSVIPILAAVFFLVRAIRRPRLTNALLCGVCLGLSCWLRANALLLPIFFAVAALLVVGKERRATFAGLLLAAFLFTIAPVTIRNALCFQSFIPLALGGGTTVVEGLGDIDDGSRGLPRTDEGVMDLDAKLDGSESRYTTLYDPEGVARDRRRLSFGWSTIRSEPLWFARGVAKRGLSTFRLERVPAVVPERDERETTNALLYALDRPLKLVQRAFVTAAFLPLTVLGLVVLALKKRWSELVAIVTVPSYFATVQTFVHTEYRYVLATPHMLMIAAAVGMCWLCGRVVRSACRNRERPTAAQ